MSKVINLKKLKTICKNLILKKKKIVFTNGCFDLIHSGHIEIISKSKKLGDVLIVLINSDRSIKKLKGKERPVIRLENRISVLQALYDVDYIHVFNDDTPIKIYKDIKPIIITKGSEYSEKEIVGSKIVKKNKGSVVKIKMVDNISTSKIIDKIKKSYDK